MKRIVRLTESDLTRIVRRVIKENNKSLLREGVGATAAKKLYDALSSTGFLGVNWSDSESGALAAIKMVKTCDELKEFVIQIRSLTGMEVNEYIDDEMSAADEEYDQIVAYWGNIVYKCAKAGKDGGASIKFNDSYGSWNHFLKWMSGRGYTISY